MEKRSLLEEGPLGPLITFDFVNGVFSILSGIVVDYLKHKHLLIIVIKLTLGQNSYLHFSER